MCLSIVSEALPKETLRNQNKTEQYLKLFTRLAKGEEEKKYAEAESLPQTRCYDQLVHSNSHFIYTSCNDWIVLTLHYKLELITNQNPLNLS